MDTEAIKKELADVSLIPELQENQQKMLESILAFFKKNNLTYFASGGTVLGSKYYDDFIPYDDDIDIAMPRKDFEKFLGLVNQKKFQLENFNGRYDVQHFLMNEKFKFTIARIENLNYDVTDIMDIQNKNAHPSVDVAPIDGSPNNVFFRTIFFIKLYFLRAFLLIAYSDSINTIRKNTLRHKIQTLIAKVSSKILRFNPTKIKKNIENTLSKYPMQTSDFSGTYMGAYRSKEMIQTKIWGNGSTGKFGSMQINLPEKVDQYVKSLYGGFSYYSDEELIKDRHYIIKKKK